MRGTGAAAGNIVVRRKDKVYRGQISTDAGNNRTGNNRPGNNWAEKKHTVHARNMVQGHHNANHMQGSCTN
jgi:hypothetical protein